MVEVVVVAVVEVVVVDLGGDVVVRGGSVVSLLLQAASRQAARRAPARRPCAGERRVGRGMARAVPVDPGDHGDLPVSPVRRGGGHARGSAQGGERGALVQVERDRGMARALEGGRARGAAAGPFEDGLRHGERLRTKLVEGSVAMVAASEVDLGEVAAQYLSLALNPYPRFEP